MSKSSEQNRSKWRKLRKRVLKRDNYQCMKCGSGENLTIDHIIPCVKDKSLIYVDDNTRTLCESCRIKNDLELWERGLLQRHNPNDKPIRKPRYIRKYWGIVNNY